MSSKRLAVVLQGVKSVDQVPGLEAAGRDVEWRCAPTADDLSEMLPGAEVLLGWDFRASELRAAWGQADRLRWIQWSGAGVDALLFPELVSSDVVLTNARGVFDRAMAECVLGFMLSFAKGFTETFRAQAERRWNYRWTEQLMGREVLIVGVGSIGREIARLLSAAGLKVQGVGRSARTGDADFGIISAVSDLDQCLAQSDYVVAIPPLTPDTHGLFGAKQFASMKKTARFINLSRGEVVDESALVAALETGQIAGAALDVFQQEPLPEDSPLWSTPNLVVSPHMSGDYDTHETTVAELFLNNLDRYARGDPLINTVDKVHGFVID